MMRLSFVLKPAIPLAGHGTEESLFILRKARADFP